jgi:hypothetical protein
MQRSRPLARASTSISSFRLDALSPRGDLGSLRLRSTSDGYPPPVEGIRGLRRPPQCYTTRNIRIAAASVSRSPNFDREVGRRRHFSLQRPSPPRQPNYGHAATALRLSEWRSDRYGVHRRGGTRRCYVALAVPPRGARGVHVALARHAVVRAKASPARAVAGRASRRVVCAVSRCRRSLPGHSSSARARLLPDGWSGSKIRRS